MTHPESRFDREARCTAIRRSIAALGNALGLDELRVIEAMAERLVRHRVEYGELDVARDTRDWIAEAADEHRDAVFYMLVDQVVRNDQRLERLRCEAADELARMDPVAIIRAAPAHYDYPAAHEVDEAELGGEGGF